jgi:hypothetical protein
VFDIGFPELMAIGVVALTFESSVNGEVNAAETELQKIAQEAKPMPLRAPAESLRVAKQGR